MMIRIKEAVVVEGKYDKIKLSSLVDGLILTTDGFGIFKDKEKLELLRTLAKTRGLLILTDSDSAGFLIRSHLTGSIENRYIKHCYIPDVFGKEKRKNKPSAEGKLGVEGMDARRLVRALRDAGVVVEEDEERKPDVRRVQKLDLYEDGLSGRPESAQRRQRFLAFMHLPQRLSVNALVEVLSSTMSFEQYRECVQACFREEEKEGAP